MIACMGQNAVVVRGSEKFREAELRETLASFEADLQEHRSRLVYLSNLQQDGGGSGGAGVEHAPTDCVVCQEPMVDRISILPCGHSFWYVDSVRACGFARGSHNGTVAQF